MSQLTSAGGIVYKKEGENIFILMCQPKDSKRWVFPKGKVGDKVKNESIEEAAVREVREESGATARIIASLEPISFWYTWGEEKTQKTVYYFLMEYISGDISHHDFEMSEVEWFLMDEVDDKLKYKGDKSVWEEAKILLMAKSI